MKMLCILMLAASLQIAARGYSQSISITLKNEPLEKLFTAVEQQTNFRFVYSQEAMELSKHVTIEVKNETLENILKLGFTSQPLTYSIDEKFIIVKIADKKKEIVVLFHDINGRVVNENGEGVIVTITEKGTTNAVSTDADGYFQLKGVDENSVLVVTGVGIETMEIKVAGKSSISISVKTKITGLTEVIINKGYYSTSRKLNTGNVSKVTAETISKQPISNPLSALQGRVSGLQITQLTGVPGGAFTVRLRGQNSIANGNDPLYIIDGVPFSSTSISSTAISLGTTRGGNPLSSINPADIESIEILKDADATAIYGSRAANGIILITTKKGKAGKTKVDVNIYTGIGKVTRFMDLMNTQQYLQMRHEAFSNDGVIPTSSNARDLLVWDTTRYTDWQKLLIGGSSHFTDAQVSLSGGNVNTQFLIGGAYHKESTVFPGDFAANRASVHFNLNHISTDQKFKLLFSNSYVNEINNMPGIDPTQSAFILPPLAPPVYNGTGQLNWGLSASSSFSNPFSIFLRKYKVNTDNLISNVILSYQVFPSLQMKASLGFNNIQLDELSTNPKSSISVFSSSLASARFGKSGIKTWILEPQLNYDVKIGNGKLNTLIGTTFQENIGKGEVLIGTNYTSDALIENISAAPSISTSISYSKYRYNAVFGRINYNWTDKYLINLTARRDGSSRFGPGKQFANFGAIGLAWIFSKEKFTNDNLSFLSYGKLRGSYGTSGNDQLGDYNYLDTYSPTSNPYQGILGLSPNRLLNPDFAWELNKKLEANIELGFLKDRILFSTSYYRNRSSNQLVGYSLAPTTGFGSIQYNLPATVQNSGWEFELNTTNIRSENFRWLSEINVSIPRNKLIDYPNIEGSPYANIYQIGKSLNIQKKYHFVGVNSQTGVYIFEDVDGNGSISSPADLQALKKVEQNFYGGLQNSILYKNWQIDFFFQFVKQTGRNYLYNSPDLPGNINNLPTYFLNHWQKPGDISDLQRLSQNYGSAAASAWFNLAVNSTDNSITDASFIRMKNLSLSYMLPGKWGSKLRLTNSRIYLQGQNLFTITSYKGYDPENQSTSILSPLRIITIGVQLIF